MDEEIYAVIKLSAEHSKMSVVKSQFITSRSYNSIFMKFELETEDWNGITVTAIFNEEYVRVLDETLTCAIPEEVLDEEGYFQVGLFGVAGDYRINTNQICFKVHEGSYDEGIPPADITQSVYDEIMIAIGKKADKTYVDEKLWNKADEDHDHDGVYQPVGDYILEDEIAQWAKEPNKPSYSYDEIQGTVPEKDPTVPNWAKQPEKPVYTYDEIKGTPPEVDLTGYATERYVDRAISEVKLTGDKAYVHIQGSASREWTVTHNMDKYPAVTVVDSAGSVVVGDVTYIDKNKLSISFVGSFSGKAFLN